MGKYWRSSPFVFSVVPRCHGEWGSTRCVAPRSPGALPAASFGRVGTGRRARGRWGLGERKSNRNRLMGEGHRVRPGQQMKHAPPCLWAALLSFLCEGSLPRGAETLSVSARLRAEPWPRPAKPNKIVAFVCLNVLVHCLLLAHKTIGT